MSYKKRRRRLKKKPIIILICIILVIFISVKKIVKTIDENNYKKTNEYKLMQVGYNKDEIKIINDNTNEEFITYLLDNDYDKEYINIIKEPYYIKNNLTKYIEYYEDNIDTKTSDIIAIINTGSNKEYYKDIKETDTSKGTLMINNKYYKLPDNYAPDDLVTIKNWYSYGSNNKIKKEVYESFLKMYEDAKKEKITLIINSAYRSEKDQKKTYDEILKNNTQDFTDKKAARPGHSEHQTGLALDLITYGANGDNFDKTDAFNWLLNNAHNYGFILRYPKGKEYLTGYSYESWHYRYVGVEAATIIHDDDITFDEYYAYYVNK